MVAGHTFYHALNVMEFDSHQKFQFFSTLAFHMFIELSLLSHSHCLGFSLEFSLFLYIKGFPFKDPAALLPISLLLFETLPWTGIVPQILSSFKWTECTWMRTRVLGPLFRNCGNVIGRNSEESVSFCLRSRCFI